MPVTKITIDELKAKLDSKERVVLLDVRNSTDFNASGVTIGMAVRIPVGELEKRYTELDAGREVVAFCT